MAYDTRVSKPGKVALLPQEAHRGRRALVHVVVVDDASVFTTIVIIAEDMSPAFQHDVVSASRA